MPSPMAMTDSHPGYQSASHVAHRTTVVTYAKLTTTTSAKQRGNSSITCASHSMSVYYNTVLFE